VDVEDDLILNVLLDFHLWIYTKFTVQKYLLEIVLPTILTQRKVCSLQYILPLLTHSDQPYPMQHMRYRYGSLVVRLLESMKMFYWSVEASVDVMATDPVIHASTKRVIAQRPTAVHLRMLRYYLLDLLGQVVAPDITYDETRDFFHFLIECKDPEQYVDMLKFIQRLIQMNNTFLAHVKSFGKELFLIPLDFRSSRVRHNLT